MRESSSWDAGVKIPSFPKLKSLIEVDVVIIGGGLTGITAAYLLRKSGLKVALIEKNVLMAGATGATTAFLTQSIDTEITNLIRMFGRAKAKVIMESHQYAINVIEEIVKENKIECEFVRCPDYLFAINENNASSLHDEAKAAKSIGINVRLSKDNELNFGNFGYLMFPKQGKFHPSKYLSKLIDILIQNNVPIFEKTEAKKIRGRGPYRVDAPQGSIVANQVIVATYAPFNKKLYFKKAFYYSYVFELRIPKGVLKEAIYEDLMNPYHYFRVDRINSHDRMIIGGEDHRADIRVSAKRNFNALEDYIKTTFPGLKYKIMRKWHGPIIEPVDGIAFIGKINDENIYYATGFSGNGMTYATLSSLIIVNKIVGKKDKQIERFASAYGAKRTPSIKQLAIKGMDYSEELAKGAIKNTIKYRGEKL